MVKIIFFLGGGSKNQKSWKTQEIIKTEKIYIVSLQPIITRYTLQPEVSTTSGRGCFATSQAHRHTYRRISTLWLNQPSGPMGRFSLKKKHKAKSTLGCLSKGFKLRYNLQKKIYTQNQIQIFFYCQRVLAIDFNYCSVIYITMCKISLLLRLRGKYIFTKDHWLTNLTRPRWSGLISWILHLI